MTSASAPPPPPLLLLLIRHAEQATMQVRDAELSARGRRQALRLAERLAHLPLTAVVASPMRRAQATAQAVALLHGLTVETEADLEEVRINEASRASRYVQRAADSRMEPSEGDYARAAMAGVRVVPGIVWGSDGGESGAGLRTRVIPAMERVVSRHPGGVVACVAHGGVINAVLGEWTGQTRDMWFVPWHTGVSSVLVSGAERVLLGVNDASHLARDEDMLHLVAAHVRGR
ncbi:MAG TPA: histidine phosphatase family protein [Candidatus Angelobacter sp.]|nr:histidine phosphatase family protein [Candidatus Angelobacter sp.]